jgi:hypothetical protein
MLAICSGDIENEAITTSSIGICNDSRASDVGDHAVPEAYLTLEALHERIGGRTVPDDDDGGKVVTAPAELEEDETHTGPNQAEDDADDGDRQQDGAARERHFGMPEEGNDDERDTEHERLTACLDPFLEESSRVPRKVGTAPDREECDQAAGEAAECEISRAEELQLGVDEVVGEPDGEERRNAGQDGSGHHEDESPQLAPRC